jgi:hypothetical protein
MSVEMTSGVIVADMVEGMRFALGPVIAALKPDLVQTWLFTANAYGRAAAISAGDTVEWRNQDLVPHTSTAGSGRWDSHSIPPDSSWRAVLTTRGPEPYGCLLHPIMKARLEVR